MTNKRMPRRDVKASEGFTNRYGLDTLPAWRRPVGPELPHTKPGEVAYWSGKAEPPAIGATVHVKMNGIGKAKVLAYFVEYGWLGIEVLPEKPPAWYVKQNGTDCSGGVFGAELKEE